jgi:hypothetical protein
VCGGWGVEGLSTGHFITMETALDTQYTGCGYGWLGLAASLDLVEQSKTPFACCDSNPGRQVCIRQDT